MHPGMRSLRLGTTPGISASLASVPASEELSFGTAASRPWENTNSATTAITGMVARMRRMT
jgi:hypothetical protein